MGFSSRAPHCCATPSPLVRAERRSPLSHPVHRAGGRSQRKASRPAGLFYQHEVIVPVSLPAILVGLGADRFFLAVADGLQLACSYAALNQGLTGRIGTALAQGQVVHAGAALIAVALDLDFP